MHADILRRTGRLYRRGRTERGPLDVAVADALRSIHENTDRIFVAQVAHAMWRNHRVVDVLEQQDRSWTTEALVAVVAVLHENVDAKTLPFDAKGLRARVAQAESVRASMSVAQRSVWPRFVVAAVANDDVTAAMQLPAPRVLRANTLKASREDVAAALRRDGVTTNFGVEPDALVVVGHAVLHTTTAYQDGLFEVQDEGSQAVAAAVGAQPGEVIVDLCAGAGGKTLHLAAQMKGTGVLYACDVHRGRLQGLRARASRAGAHNIRIHELTDDGDMPAHVSVAADRVLVDAPCSGSGVVRRNPDIGWKLREADIPRLTSLQRSILDRAATLVRPGGMLVYATCSVLRAENEELIDAWIGVHRGFSRGERQVIHPLDAGSLDGFFVQQIRCDVPS
jgi:16S rRNA (cytosine967-C5)-methyltransferase